MVSLVVYGQILGEFIMDVTGELTPPLHFCSMSVFIVLVYMEHEGTGWASLGFG